MRRILLLAALALAACSPPSSQTTTGAPSAESVTTAAPTQTACNTLAPDITRQVRLTRPPVALAATPELEGGPLPAGVYDLTSGSVLDGAPEWNEARAVAIEVAESENGVTLNWAATNPGAEITRWTARFHQGPPAQLSFICGRSGDVAVHGSASRTQVQLRLPDPSGTGSDAFVFTRRG